MRRDPVCSGRGAQTSLGYRAERHERDRHEPIVALVREALGEERFRSAWAAGSRMSLEEAAAEVLRKD